MIQSRKQSGFTLLEMMLSMGFVAGLLLVIAATTIQISGIYNKGITLREVNRAGRDISDDMQRTISQAAPFEVDILAPDTKFIDLPGGGRLCTGTQTYAWNFGEALVGGSGAPLIVNRYQDNSPVRFVRTPDPGASLCADTGLSIDISSAVELLSSGDRELALHEFSILESARDDTTTQSLYAVSFTIGTNDQGQLTTNNNACEPPDTGNGSENYCSVNKFDMIVRTGSKGGQ